MTTKTTEVYLPARRYAEPLRAGLAEVILSDGKWEYKEEVGLGYRPSRLRIALRFVCRIKPCFGRTRTTHQALFIL